MLCDCRSRAIAKWAAVRLPSMGSLRNQIRTLASTGGANEETCRPISGPGGRQREAFTPLSDEASVSR